MIDKSYVLGSACVQSVMAMSLCSILEREVPPSVFVRLITLHIKFCKRTLAWRSLLDDSECLLYMLDVRASVFGLCTCGQPKAAHAGEYPAASLVAHGRIIVLKP